MVEHAAYVTALRYMHVATKKNMKDRLFNTYPDSLGRTDNSTAHADIFKHVAVNAMLSSADRSVNLV